MPLISLAAGLEHARENRYALGAFNVLDSHFLRALFAAAKQERSPFIINIAEVHFKYLSLDSLVEAVRFEAARHDIPVVLNLDHGLHFEAVVRALRLGFSSVMFDGSTLSYEENIRQTREVVKMCHAVGVSVEAELGAVGGDEGGALYGKSGAASSRGDDDGAAPGRSSPALVATGMQQTRGNFIPGMRGRHPGGRTKHWVPAGDTRPEDTAFVNHTICSRAQLRQPQC